MDSGPRSVTGYESDTGEQLRPSHQTPAPMRNSDVASDRSTCRGPSCIRTGAGRGSLVQRLGCARIGVYPKWKQSSCSRLLTHYRTISKNRAAHFESIPRNPGCVVWFWLHVISRMNSQSGRGVTLLRGYSCWVEYDAKPGGCGGGLLLLRGHIGCSFENNRT